MRNLTCRQCGWVHFAVSRQHAINAIRQFNDYYDSLSPDEQQECYGGRKASLVRTYGTCNRCGAKNTRSRTSTGKELDAIRGCTIGPLIAPEEKVV